MLSLARLFHGKPALLSLFLFFSTLPTAKVTCAAIKNDTVEADFEFIRKKDLSVDWRSGPYLLSDLFVWSIVSIFVFDISSSSIYLKSIHGKTLIWLKNSFPDLIYSIVAFTLCALSTALFVPYSIRSPARVVLNEGKNIRWKNKRKQKQSDEGIWPGHIFSRRLQLPQFYSQSPHSRQRCFPSWPTGIFGRRRPAESWITSAGGIGKGWRKILVEDSAVKQKGLVDRREDHRHRHRLSSSRSPIGGNLEGIGVLDPIPKSSITSPLGPRKRGKEEDGVRFLRGEEEVLGGKGRVRGRDTKFCTTLSSTSRGVSCLTTRLTHRSLGHSSIQTCHNPRSPHSSSSKFSQAPNQESTSVSKTSGYPKSGELAVGFGQWSIGVARGVPVWGIFLLLPLLPCAGSARTSFALSYRDYASPTTPPYEAANPTSSPIQASSSYNSLSFLHDHSYPLSYHSQNDGQSSTGHSETDPCAPAGSVWFSPAPALHCALLIALVAYFAGIMYKVLRSYQKKAERRHEVTGGESYDQRSLELTSGGNDSGVKNGQVVPAGPAPTGAWGSRAGAYSESSSFETHEHFERKVQRVKKTRGDRDRRRGKKVDHWGREEDGVTGKEALLQWTQRVTAGYPGVNVRNFTNSWRDGLAFNAVIHRYRPEVVDWRGLRDRTNRDRLETAFNTAHQMFGVERLLDPEDVDRDMPDEKSLITYISSLYEALPNSPEYEKYEHDMQEYSVQATEWFSWVRKATTLMQERRFPNSSGEIRQLLKELDNFKSEDLPPRLRSKVRLADLVGELQRLFTGTGQLHIDEELSTEGLDRAWNTLLKAIDDRERLLREKLGEVGAMGDRTRSLQTEIGIVNEKLDLILNRMDSAEAKIDKAPADEMKGVLDGIVFDLHALEPNISNLFADVEELKVARHPEASDYHRQVFGLHQRHAAYLQRLETQLLVQYNQRSEFVTRLEVERYERTRTNVFQSCEECIAWIEERISILSNMEFIEDTQALENMFEQHKLDHRDIMDFRQNVDQCIGRQAEVSAEDSGVYCDLLSTLESDYQQLRDLSTGRMLDLDSLIAFVRAAQIELVWMSEREEIEVARQWSDINQLDLPMLQNYYKQLLHEIELQEAQFNSVHNQGAALLNQGHPAVNVIEAYLTTMQTQWDWLLSLARCLEIHLGDALNLKQFTEEAQTCEQWMERQTELLESHYDRTDFSLEEGEKLLRELDEIYELLDKYHEVLISLIDRSRTISPLWQRGERVGKPTPATALCDYSDGNITVRRGDECRIMDNTDLIRWVVRNPEGVEAVVPSVVFRFPPPDPRLVGYLQRLQGFFDRLKKLWIEKHRLVRFNMVLNTMRTIRSWNLEQFLAIDPDQREAIMKALNEDTNKLLSEMDPNDPLALRLREELRLTNEHFFNLLQMSMKGPEPDIAEQYDKKLTLILPRLDDAWRTLNERVADHVPRTQEALEKCILDHKNFEDHLQSLDSEITALKELYQQLPDPTPMQRSKMEQLLTRWEDLWELSRMYVERLKALELVLNGMSEASQIIKEHEITLGSCDKMPADPNVLRAVHAQLLELNMILQQQQPIMDELGNNAAQVRQHVARTRFNVTDHPDVDRLEDDVQKLTVRWENICAQILDRLKSSEMAIQILMVYRSDYENEISWLDRVERTINNLRDPSHLRPEEYQEQLELLISEYAQLNERTQAIEHVNNEGGKYIREARAYDLRLTQYEEALEEVHGHSLASLLRRKQPPPLPGADQVTQELELLNRRFSQLASVILERRNVIQVLIQNWKRQQQADEDRSRADEEARRRAEEEARRRAAEEADRLRRLREEEEARRRNDEEEAERLRRLRLEEEARRREEEARRRAEEEARRRAEEEARRRAAEEEARRRAEEEARRRAEEEARRRADEERLRQKVQVEIPIRAPAPKPEIKTTETYKSRLHIAGKPAKPEQAQVHVVFQEPPKPKPAPPPEPKPVPKPQPTLNIQRSMMQGEAILGEEVTGFEEVINVGERARITEHEEEMQMYQEETVTKTQFYELEAVKHMKTGEILTFVEAIRQGLLDLQSGSGEFYDIVSDSKISLEKAAELGHVSQSFNDCLQTTYGLRDPDTKEELTLIQAIQKGIYDPDSRQLRDPETGEVLGLYESVSKGIISLDQIHRLVKMGILKLPPLPLDQAIDQNVINLETGMFTGRYSRETLPLKEALRHGYVTLVSSQQPVIAMTLTDVIEKRYINAQNGEFKDKNSQDEFTLRDAVSRASNLINLQAREIINTSERKRVSNHDAVVRNVLNTRQGNFTDLQKRQSISLQQAYDEGYIQKPMTLTEVCAKDQIDSVGRFIDGGTRKRMTLIEAMAEGLLDPEVRHIVDPEEQEVICLSDAIERGIITPDGKYIHPETQQDMTIAEAANRDFLIKRMHHSIFDVRAVKNLKTGQNVSFNEAIDEGIIVLSAERFVNLANEESCLLPDSAEEGIIDPMLHKILSSFIGIKDNYDNEINVFKAVCQGLIDTRKSVFLNKNYNQELSPKQAYEARLISLRGAMQLEAFFDVHPSLITNNKPTKLSTKRVRRPGASVDDEADDQVRITLAEAMKQGMIDSRSQRFRQGDQEMSLQDALNKGLIDASSEWIVPSKADKVGPTIEESTTESVSETSQQLAPKIFPDKNLEESVTTVKRQRTTETTSVGGPGGVSAYRAITGGKGSVEVPVEGMHLLTAERNGLIDLSTGIVSPPQTNRMLTMEEAFELGLLSSKHMSVKGKNGRSVSFADARSEGLIDETGHVLDMKSHRNLNLKEAIDQGLVAIEAEPPEIASASKKVIQFGAGPAGAGPVMQFTPVGNTQYEDVEDSWSFDASTGEVVDGTTGERLALDEAIRREQVPREDVRVLDALTGREMSYNDACKWGIVDPTKDYYVDKRDGRRYSLQDAATQGQIFLTGGVPEHARDAIKTTSHKTTRKRVTKKEALVAGPAAFADYSIQQVIDLGWYNADTGMLTHPDTKKQMTLKESIMKGLFNPYESVVIDNSKGGKKVSLLEAIQSGLIDANTGMVNDGGRKINLKEACSKNIICSGAVPQTLESALRSGSFDVSEAVIRTPDKSKAIGLHEAISSGYIDGSSVMVKDPASGKHMTVTEAASRRPAIVDLNRGLVINSRTGEATAFSEAIRSGVLSPDGMSSEQVSSVYSSNQMQVAVPQRSGSSSTMGGQRQELVDLGGGKQVMVKVIRGEDGVDKGEYIDQTTGMKFTVQLHGDPYVTQTKTSVKSTSQVQSVELEPHAEFAGIDKVRDMRTGRVMSLKDAQRMGLAKVDKKGKQQTKSYSAFRSDLAHALSEGIVDAERNQQLSLEDAIKSKLVDISKIVYHHPVSGEVLDFTRAANMGLVDVTLAEVLPKGVCNPANGERITIQKAIEMNIIDPRSGKVRNPFNNEPLTWLDVLKSVYASLTNEGVYDPRKGHAVPVTSALNEGLINAKTEEYSNPITGKKFSLKEACEKGLIDETTLKAITREDLPDWRSRSKVSLLKAVSSKLVDPHSRTIELAKGSVVPIARAAQDGKIPADIGNVLKRVDKWTFADALGQGLIDVAANQFTDPETDRKMTITQALEQGYIDTGSVESMEGANRNLHTIIRSEEFDINSGRIRDQKTGLHLTFRQAVQQGLIDPDSLIYDVDSGKTLTLHEAEYRGLIDQNGKYIDSKTETNINLKDAIASGLIAVIESPMVANQAVAEAIKRRDAEGFKFKLEQVNDGSSQSHSRSKPGVHTATTETVKMHFSSPHKGASPLRVKTEVFSSSTQDPLAIADRQYEFFDNLKTQGVNHEDLLIQNPASGRQVSVKEAVESGLLDIQTGEIVHPMSGRRYSIPRGVHMKMITQDSAKKIMETLNLSIEELLSISPRSESSPRQYSPATGGGSSSTSYTKEVNWHGKPSELRSTGLDPYTKVSGSRDTDGGGYTVKSSTTSYRRSGGPQCAADAFGTDDQVEEESVHGGSDDDSDDEPLRSYGLDIGSDDDTDDDGDNFNFGLHREAGEYEDEEEPEHIVYETNSPSSVHEHNSTTSPSSSDEQGKPNTKAGLNFLAPGMDLNEC